MINDYTFGYAIIFVTFDFLSFQLSGFVTQYRILLGYLSLMKATVSDRQNRNKWPLPVLRADVRL